MPNSLITPPQDREAERSVLGAILLENKSFPSCVQIIKNENYFYIDAHQKIWNTIVNLFDKNQPFDGVTIPNALKQKGWLKEIGGIDYLENILESASTSENIEYHAQIVKDKYILRKLIIESNEITKQCYKNGEINEILNNAEKSIFQISIDNSGLKHVKETIIVSMAGIEASTEKPGLISGIPTGYIDLDSKISGLNNSDLIIIAGRPSMGKTSLAINIAEHISCKNKKITAIFSLEMSVEQLTLRMLCSQARVSSNKIKSGYLGREDWHKLVNAAAIISDSNIFIDDSANLSALEIRTNAKRLQSEHGLDLVIIDYIQLMKGSKSENRQQEISNISRSLKQLAKELKIPVIALSQLSRATEQRTGDKRPILADLRDSGAIEQDADVVMFVFREERYDPTPENKGIAEIIIGKQRHGPIGTVELAFLGDLTRFENLTDERKRNV